MSFARPEWLWFLLLVPAAWLLAVAGGMLRKRDASRFAAISGRVAVRGARFAAPSLLALGMTLLALTGPRYGETRREVPVKGIDVVVLMDASRSMLVGDVEPDRLGRAKREVLELAERFEGGRMGLVTFGGSGELVCPLTHDRTSFVGFVTEVDPELTPYGGTNIALGLRKALEVFDEESSAQRVIVLLGDGENLNDDSEADAAAWLAYSRGVVVHTLLVGSTNGGPVPGRALLGDRFVTDQSGKVVVSVPNQEIFASLSDRTGGLFLNAQEEPFPADRLHRERLSEVRLSGLGVAWRREPIDRYQWLLLPAAMLLVWRLLRRLPRVLMIVPLLFVIAWSDADETARRAVERFEAEQFEDAVGLFEEAARQHPESATHAFNLGAASYRSGDYRRAMRVFERCRAMADGPLRARAAFGGGVARARRAAELVAASGGEDRALTGQAISLLARARTDFIEALRLGAGRPAAVDLELVSRRLEELKERLRDQARQSDPSSSRATDGADEEGADERDDSGVAEAPIDTPSDEGADSEPDSAPSNRSTQEDSSVQGGESPRLPGGLLREKAGNIEDIVNRYQRERREYDRRRARASRSKVERDW